MRKIPITLLVGAMVFMFSACGQAKDEGESQTDTINDITQSRKETVETDTREMQADTIAQTRKETDEMDVGEMQADTIVQTRKETDETDAAGKESMVNDVLDSLVGEYSYTLYDSSGKLIIQKASDGYDISDYESESSYRFLANSSNIQTIENNRIYIEYPELLLSDDTVHFSYYILAYDTEGIDVYYGMTEPENMEFLYHAHREKYDKDTDKGVFITADLEVRYDGAEDTQKYEITAELVRNSYSCFDGYSIASFSSTIADNMQGDTNLSAE